MAPRAAYDRAAETADDDSSDSFAPTAVVEATEKLDGSLIIGFVHDGESFACTKRRADSEQAMWARAWLVDRGAFGHMRLGHTYMFEAVGAHNQVVVIYDYTACVLLAVVDALGVELSRPEVEAEATRLRVPVVRAVRGRVGEFVEEPRAATDLQSEGWVLKAVQSGRGHSVRRKVVRPRWQAAFVRILQQQCTGILESRDIVVTQRATAHLHAVLLPFIVHAFHGTSSMQKVERELGRIQPFVIIK